MVKHASSGLSSTSKISMGLPWVGWTMGLLCVAIIRITSLGYVFHQVCQAERARNKARSSEHVCLRPSCWGVLPTSSGRGVVGGPVADGWLGLFTRESGVGMTADLSVR